MNQLGMKLDRSCVAFNHGNADKLLECFLQKPDARGYTQRKGKHACLTKLWQVTVHLRLSNPKFVKPTLGSLPACWRRDNKANEPTKVGAAEH